MYQYRLNHIKLVPALIKRYRPTTSGKNLYSNTINRTINSPKLGSMNNITIHSTKENIIILYNILLRNTIIGKPLNIRLEGLITIEDIKRKIGRIFIINNITFKLFSITSVSSLFQVRHHFLSLKHEYTLPFCSIGSILLRRSSPMLVAYTN